MDIRIAGSCLGYGMARFRTPCAGLQARHVLDGRDLRAHTVHCQWAKEGAYSHTDLHSKVSFYYIR